MPKAGHLPARLAENKSRFFVSQPELMGALMSALSATTQICKTCSFQNITGQRLTQRPTIAIDQTDIDRLLASFE